MNKKIVTTILIFIFIILVIVITSKFGFFIFPSKTKVLSADCIFRPIGDLVNESGLIIIGTVQDSKWITHYPSISTNTTLKVLSVVKGEYPNEEIIVKTDGGCDIISNYCVKLSDVPTLEEGNTYLLFLTDKDIRGVYGGLTNCSRGAHKLATDNQGNLLSEILFSEITQEDNGVIITKNYTREDLIKLIR